MNARQERRLLTDRERSILEHERKWYRFPGRRDAMIMERFGISGVRYSQILVDLVELPAATAYDPATVGRLRRQFADSRARHLRPR